MAALLMGGAPHALGCMHGAFSGRQLTLRPLTRAVQINRTVQAAQIGPLKKWEHYPTNKNGTVIRHPMPIKKGDTVQVISGADKGKIGAVTKVVPKMGQIIVEGVNIKTRHNKPVKEGEPGNISERESPIHHSNAMLYSKESQTRSRIGYKVDESGKKVRYLKKTGEVIDK